MTRHHDRRTVPDGSPVGARELAAVALAVLRRPTLWVVALRQLFLLARPRWWSRRPWLPLPPPEYLRFRLVTAYGGDGTVPPEVLARDVLEYLRWCRGSTG